MFDIPLTNLEKSCMCENVEMDVALCRKFRARGKNKEFYQYGAIIRIIINVL